ncbi:hypothetical protein [Haladaptatus paucihalophilus]|nr:hypothetical protein [Haladaptatus paucihalophilus]
MVGQTMPMYERGDADDDLAASSWPMYGYDDGKTNDSSHTSAPTTGRTKAISTAVARPDYPAEHLTV